MKSLGIIILTFIYSSISPANLENPCGVMEPRGGDEDWGEGAYHIPEVFQVDLYDNTFVKKMGTLRSDHFYLSLFDDKGKKATFSWDDLEWIGHYEHLLLKYRSCMRADFINVLWKSAPNKYYIKTKDLIAQKLHPHTYKEYLFDDNISEQINKFKSTANLGVNLTKRCLNLREGPSIKSKKIRCIGGNNWENKELVHLKILKHQGDWAEVEVINYYILEEQKDIEGENDCNFSEKNRQHGWVKAIDDTGFPNIWFSVASY